MSKLLPPEFSITAKVLPGCEGQTGCGDLFLLGGDDTLEGGCGAMYVYWRETDKKGTFGFGVQVQGAPIPSAISPLLLVL